MATAEETRAYREARKGRIFPEDHDRFWKRVNKNGPNGCWVWTGAIRKRDGYGQFDIAGRNVTPHLALWMLTGVKVPDGLVTDHTCRNTLCCNPDHLRFVTQGVNTTENSDSWWAKNKAKTHCVHGHPLHGEGVARILRRYKPNGRYHVMRQCLVCYPGMRNHPLRFWLPEDLPGVSIAD